MERKVPTYLLKMQKLYISFAFDYVRGYVVRSTLFLIMVGWKGLAWVDLWYGGNWFKQSSHFTNLTELFVLIKAWQAKGYLDINPGRTTVFPYKHSPSRLYSSVISKGEFFIQMRASWLLLSFQQKRGAIDRGWVPNRPFSFDWNALILIGRHSIKWGRMLAASNLKLKDIASKH